MSFVDDLNSCVADVGRMQRPRFESGLSADAYRWITAA